MYQRLLEDFLTHYQPEMKAELLRHGTLSSYLEAQNLAMMETRKVWMAQMKSTSFPMSQTQLEMEADQMIREMYLTPV